MKNGLNIDKLITIDNSGMPCAPELRQLLDKDILALYKRDTTSDKSMYIKECGVIYYLGDPKSPAKQQGLDDRESLKLAIENFDLPKDYHVDELVGRLIMKYYKQNITEAGVAIEALRQSVHLMAKAATAFNKILSADIDAGLTKESLSATLNLMADVKKNIQDIPNLTKSLSLAYQNLQTEEEEQLARGGKAVLSSMDADEETI